MDPFKDPQFLSQLEAAVGKAEAGTDAEIVVALSPLSGSYRDVDHRFGAAAALLVLATLVLGPRAVEPTWLVASVVVAYGVGLGLAARLSPIRRLMTPRRRRRSQVARASRLAFVEESVHATKDRYGVLLYVSFFERIAEVVADTGCDGKVDPARFYEIAQAVSESGCSAPAVLEAIAKLGDALAKPFPKRQGDPNEIPNAPRVHDGGAA